MPGCISMAVAWTPGHRLNRIAHRYRAGESVLDEGTGTGAVQYENAASEQARVLPGQERPGARGPKPHPLRPRRQGPACKSCGNVIVAEARTEV